jgi:sec-independent protein translocase protein TatC
MSDEKRPFLEHLEELRRRILFSLAALLSFGVLSYSFSENILRCLVKDVEHLIFISPQEAFLAHLKIALASGLVLSSPIILFNLLGFVWSALHKEEKHAFIGYFVSGCILFVAGASFSYAIALPAAMRFLLGFSSDLVRPYISVSRYISFSIFLILSFAIAFETPLFVMLLTRVGIVNARILRAKRRYCIVFLFVMAAVLTPPDVITQILLAVPLLVLYEISIWVSQSAQKKKE